MDKKLMISKIEEIHSDDREQINFVLSEEKRLLVTAPAGYGKTKSMISKIAFELISKPDMNFKKILALTFSVNAAAKIKNDILEVLPQLLNDEFIGLDEKLDISNYHAFSTKLIYKHWYVFDKTLKKVENFTIVSESDKSLKKYLSEDELQVLSEHSIAVKEVNTDKADKLEERCTDILLDKLIPNNIITYNGILLLGMRILSQKSIQNFYKKYYPLIIIDEFQDTNYLAYKLVIKLISSDNKIILIGDEIQKIYGFLGAIPDIFSKIKNEYNMTLIEFKTSHRFKHNSNLGKLDCYIRNIFNNYEYANSISENAEINLKVYKNDSEEAKAIVDNMSSKLNTCNNKVALLVPAKYNANSVINELESCRIKYFNGLFSDIDIEYNEFHKIALDEFTKESGTRKSISTDVIDRTITNIKRKKELVTKDDTQFNSLMRLLSVLFVSIKSSKVSREEKYNKIIFILKSNSLKRMMNGIEEDIVLTTIHGSKGLEWDYIYIPEINASKFPRNKNLCESCRKGKYCITTQKNCRFDFPRELKQKFEEELSLFYVAITRAKKDAFLFANTGNNQHGYPKKLSCLATLPNLITNDNI